MKVFSCEQMRKIEEKAYKKGMSYIQMMENAGRSCFEAIEKICNEGNEGFFTVICGSGKNGGDGFVIARLLKNNGYNVNVVLACGEPKADEAKEMYAKLQGLSVDIINANLYLEKAIEIINESTYIIDCIFGIGFKGQIKGDCAKIIDAVNNAENKIFTVSVDIPSGLEGDSNNVKSDCIKADFTLAVTCKKPVHAMKPSVDLCGNVEVIDIGFDDDCYNLPEGSVFESFDNIDFHNSLPERKFDSNKGTFGKLLCICGSMKMQGAAVLCSNAAVRSGAGIVISAFPDKAYCAIASKLTEPLMLPLPSDDKGFISCEAKEEILSALESASAVVIGCGLGVTQTTKEITEMVLLNAKCPVLIDADGLNALNGNIDIIKKAKSSVILTPHPGEMSRLLNKTVDEIQSDRVGCCKELNERTGAVILLKGANTVICHNGRLFINSTGCPAMAKGGSGDVLSGIIGALLAQGVSPLDSAVSGAYVHGKAGEFYNDFFSELSVTASDLTEALPYCFK